MKVLLLGAGVQGGPCASILARDKDVSEIVLGDIDINLANKVKDKIKSDKINVVKVDASKIEDIKGAARGVDVIINLTLCPFNLNIMKAALESRTHYVDGNGDDLLPTQIIKRQPLEFDDEFREAGLTGLFGCGGCPGIVNVLARYSCDKLDRVSAIRIKCGFKFLEMPKEIVSAWEPRWWAPEGTLYTHAVEPIVFENGEYRKYPPFSGCEEYNFPDPVGLLLICYQGWQMPVTLPHFIGKNIRHVDFKFPLDPLAATFVKMGFDSSAPIDVKDVKVAPIDVLLKLVRHPVNTFFTEDERTAKLPPKSAYPYVIEINGEKLGEAVAYTISWAYSFFTNAEEKLELYRKFGTTDVTVALAAIAGAKMCVKGQTAKGVISPECLDPMKFLKVIADMGAAVKFHEMLSKKVSLS